MNVQDTYVVQEPGESPNDRNDRAIRVAAAWYSKRVPSMKIILVTADALNREKALSEGLHAFSVPAYAQTKLTAFPDIMDVLSRYCTSRLLQCCPRSCSMTSGSYVTTTPASSLQSETLRITFYTLYDC